MLTERKIQLQSLSRLLGSSGASGGVQTGVAIKENMNRTTNPQSEEIDRPSIPRLAQGGEEGKKDNILKDKIRFTVSGVTIAAGKPSIWSRLATAAIIKTMPNLNPVVNQLFKDRKNQSTWSEPAPPYAAQHPYNKVQQTESGHVIELDDTPGAERVHIFHRSGSFIEFHPNGNVVVKNVKNGYNITMADQHVKVNGKCHVAVDGGATFYVKGNVDIQSEGDINFQAKKDFNVYASNINLRAKKTFKGDGTKIDLRYVVLPVGIMPAIGGFVPKINMAALLMDFPGGNFNTILSTFGKNPLDPRAGNTTVAFGSVGKVPLDNPLSNPAVYTKKTEKAVNYRALMFDAPEETSDFELYTAHVGLQEELGDIAKGTNPRELAGTLRVPTDVTVPAQVTPTVNYLNVDDYRGNFTYANDTLLGGTTFKLSDLTDLALYPEVVTPVKPGAAPAGAVTV